jgi:hypothetical protein
MCYGLPVHIWDKNQFRTPARITGCPGHLVRYVFVPILDNVSGDSDTSISTIEEEQETVLATNSTHIQTISVTRKLKQKKGSFRKDYSVTKASENISADSLSSIYGCYSTSEKVGLLSVVFAHDCARNV